MPKYSCSKCNKEYIHKGDFKKHLNRKTPCNYVGKNGHRFNCIKCGKSYTKKSTLTLHINKFHPLQMIVTKNDSENTPINGENLQIYSENAPIKGENEEVSRDRITCANSINIPNKSNDNNRCNFCNKTFTLKRNLMRHLKYRCKVKRDQNDEKKRIYQALVAKMNAMEDKIAKLETENGKLFQMTNSNNTINNNSNTTNNTMNINLVAFGQEDKDSLSNNEIFQILKRGFSSIPELVKALHFNENRPENHNIYISNMRDNYVMVYDGDKWTLRDRTETMENIFDDGRDFLVVKLNDIKDMLNDRQKCCIKKFERFDHDIDYHEKKKVEILNDIKLILYNNKDIPLQTRKIV